MKPLQIWILSFILFAGVSSSAVALEASGATTPPEKKLTCVKPEIVPQLKAKVLEIIAKVATQDELRKQNLRHDWGDILRPMVPSLKKFALSQLFHGLIAHGDIDGAREVYKKAIEMEPSINVMDAGWDVKYNRPQASFPGSAFDNDILLAFVYIEALEGRKAAIDMLGKAPKRARLGILSGHAKNKIKERDMPAAWEFIEPIVKEQAAPYDDKDFPTHQTCNYDAPKYSPYDEALLGIGAEFAQTGNINDALKVSEKLSGKQLIQLLKTILDKQHKGDNKALIAQRGLSEVDKFYKNQPKDSHDYLDDKIEMLVGSGDYAAATEAISHIGDRYIQDMTDQQQKHCEDWDSISEFGSPPIPANKYTPQYYRNMKYRSIMNNAFKNGRYDDADKYKRMSGDVPNISDTISNAAYYGDYPNAKKYFDKLIKGGGTISVEIQKRIFDNFVSKGMNKEAQLFAPPSKKPSSKKLPPDKIQEKIQQDLREKNAQDASAMLNDYLGIDTSKDGLVDHRRLALLFVEKGMANEAKQILVDMPNKLKKMQDWERSDALQDMLLVQQAVGDQDGIKITEQNIARADKLELPKNLTAPADMLSHSNDNEMLWISLPDMQNALIRQLKSGEYEKALKTNASIARNKQRQLTLDRHTDPATGMAKIDMNGLRAMEKDPAYTMDEGNAYAREFFELAKNVVIMDRRLSRDDLAGAMKAVPPSISNGMGDTRMFGAIMAAELKAGYLKEAMDISNQIQDDGERVSWLTRSLTCDYSYY